jgi:hypothetical protein
MIEVKMTGARWLVLESEHPCINTDVFTPVTIPGATGYLVTFDEQTLADCGVWSAYFIFYKNDQHVEYWGEQYYLSNTPKPGVGGNPPLEIPADNFVMFFRCDVYARTWGYRLIIKPTNDIPTSITDVWYASASITQILPDGTFNST